MGGLAFSHIPGVQVPRMRPELYERVVAEVSPKLCRIFQTVEVPLPVPGKKDHGDVDFLVGGVIAASPDEDIWLRIEVALDAKLHIGGNSHSFGLQHPELPDAYVQVDVEIVPVGDNQEKTDEMVIWTYFMKSYGDLLQIIGICHRSLGLVCTDKGLHVRIAAIESYNKKKARLFLTLDPSKAMLFLGLDVEKYWAGFSSEEELFDWVANGRFFSHQLLDQRIEKASDRSRQVRRPMYRRFMEEYVPAHPEPKPGREEPPSRLDVLREAILEHDKLPQYQAMMREHETRENEEELWQQIKDALPVRGNSLSLVLRALKRWVKFDGGLPFIVGKPILDTHPIWSKFIERNRRGDVIIWVCEHWKTVKLLEKRRMQEAKEDAKITSE